MKVENVKVYGWDDCLNAARTTARKDFLIGREPSEKFKRMMLKSEHSPIRLVKYTWVWKDIPYWVSVHYVRHHEGFLPFVSTSRPDRADRYAGRDRNEMSQGELVDVFCQANAQALINISRVRLCRKASDATRLLWNLTLSEISKVDPIVAGYCVPQCVAKGFCQEPESCRYCDTESWGDMRRRYEDR